jgi:hypothetical protein
VRLDSSPKGGEVLHGLDDLDAVDGLEEPADALADEDFVFGDDDTDGGQGPRQCDLYVVLTERC